jgi:hypothetical protein
VAITIGARLQPGSYPLAAQVVCPRRESDPTNNSWEGTLAVRPPPWPDLTIHDVQTEVVTGQPAKVRVTVLNVGPGASEATFVTLEPEAGAWGILRGDVPPLMAGGSAEVLMTIDVSLEPGSYRFIARVAPPRGDPLQNNAREGTLLIPAPPDLAIHDIRPAVVASQPATVWVTVVNNGPGSSSSTFVELRSRVWGTVRRPVPALGPGGRRVVAMTIGRVLPAGLYQFGAWVAPLPEETNTANNVGRGTFAIRPSPPDLTIRNVQPVVIAGEPARVRITVANVGSGGSRPTFVVVESESSAWGLVRGDVPPLMPGKRAVVRTRIDATLRPGSYRFIARVAPPREDPPSNNAREGTLVIPPPLQPDLTIDEVESTGVAGGLPRVGVTVVNVGRARSRPTFLSVKSDVWGIVGAEVPALKPGERTRVLTTIGVALRPGTYLFTARVAPTPEDPPQNNAREGTLAIPPPDLMIEAVRPQSVANQTVTVGVTVVNVGPGSSGPTSVELRSRAWRTVHRPIRPLKPGERTVVVMTIGRVLPAGTVRFDAWVAPLLEETNTTNNAWKGKLVRPLSIPLWLLLVLLLIALVAAIEPIRRRREMRLPRLIPRPHPGDQTSYLDDAVPEGTTLRLRVDRGSSTQSVVLERDRSHP